MLTWFSIIIWRQSVNLNTRMFILERSLIRQSSEQLQSTLVLRQNFTVSSSPEQLGISILSQSIIELIFNEVPHFGFSTNISAGNCVTSWSILMRRKINVASMLDSLFGKTFGNSENISIGLIIFLPPFILTSFTRIEKLRIIQNMQHEVLEDLFLLWSHNEWVS